MKIRCITLNEYKEHIDLKKNNFSDLNKMVNPKANQLSLLVFNTEKNKYELVNTFFNTFREVDENKINMYPFIPVIELDENHSFSSQEVSLGYDYQLVKKSDDFSDYLGRKVVLDNDFKEYYFDIYENGFIYVETFIKNLGIYSKEYYLNKKFYVKKNITWKVVFDSKLLIGDVAVMDGFKLDIGLESELIANLKPLQALETKKFMDTDIYEDLHKKASLLVSKENVYKYSSKSPVNVKKFLDGKYFVKNALYFPNNSLENIFVSGKDKQIFDVKLEDFNVTIKVKPKWLTLLEIKCKSVSPKNVNLIINDIDTLDELSQNFFENIILKGIVNNKWLLPSNTRIFVNLKNKTLASKFYNLNLQVYEVKDNEIDLFNNNVEVDYLVTNLIKRNNFYDEYYDKLSIEDKTSLKYSILDDFEIDDNNGFYLTTGKDEVFVPYQNGENQFTGDVFRKIVDNEYYRENIRRNIKKV